MPQQLCFMWASSVRLGLAPRWDVSHIPRSAYPPRDPLQNRRFVDIAHLIQAGVRLSYPRAGQDHICRPATPLPLPRIGVWVQRESLVNLRASQLASPSHPRHPRTNHGHTKRWDNADEHEPAKRGHERQRRQKQTACEGNPRTMHHG